MISPMTIKNRRSLTIYYMLISLLLLAGVFILPVSGFCAAKPAHETFERGAEISAENSAENTATESTEDTVEKAAEQPPEKAQEKTTSEVGEKVAQRTAEKAAETKAAKEELKARRPDERKGPTRIHFAVFVLDVDSIDDANQSFMTNVFLKLQWKDQRQAKPQGHTRQVRLEDAWHPQVILANRQGLVSRSLPEVVQVEPDGTVTYRQRYSGTLSQPLQLTNFPMDQHTFNIQFVSAAYSAEELEFVPAGSKIDPTIKGGLMAKDLSLPDWKIGGYEALEMPYRPIEGIDSAGFLFRFEARRYVAYYFWQIVLPLSIVVFMSWAAFWVQRGERGVRIGVATSSVLTLIAHRFVLASLIPRLPYMTRMDYFTVGCTLLVFIALFGVVLTAYFGTINRDIMAKRLDNWLRGLLPLTFLTLLGWFVTGG